MARALGWIAAVIVVAVGARLAFWNARSDARERGATGARVAAPAAVESEHGATDATPLAALAREAVSAEAPLAADPSGGTDEATDDAADEEPSDPPTPERPGPGQALLRVQTVALESGAPLAGAYLQLFGADPADDHEWRSSTQGDPSRGVENDEVHTDASGRGEFIVQADYAYRLHGEGEHGLADEVEEPFAPLHQGEEREVRLSLPTAWTLEWHGRVIDGESERPLDGVDVVALEGESDEHAPAAELARGRTAGDGRVVLRLPAWEHALVRCELTGYFFGGDYLDDDATTFDTVQQIALHRPAALVARVFDADGRPAEGVEVRVSVARFFVIQHWHGDALCWAQSTDASGRCEFPELPSLADVFVRVRRGDRELASSISGTFQLQPGERSEKEWRFEKGVTVTGRVIDRKGRGLAAVALRLTPIVWSLDNPWAARHLLDRTLPAATLNGDARVGLLVTAQTDDQGAFSIDSVPPGSWMLCSDEAEDLPAVAVPFLIRPEDATRHVEISLDRGLFIRGTVLGPDEHAVRLAAIVCRTSDGTMMCRNLWSDRDGKFVVGPLPTGSYSVQAKDAEQRFFAPSEELTVEAGAPPIVLSMRWGGYVRLHLVDGAGRALESDPEVDPRAWLFRGKESFWEHDDLDFWGLTPGVYDAVVHVDEDVVGVQRGIRVGPQDDLEVPVSVGPGARVLLPSLDDSTDVTEWEIEWEGLPLVRSLNTEFVVPPGTVVVQFFGRDADWLKHLVATQSRTLAAGEEWRVELPR